MLAMIYICCREYCWTMLKQSLSVWLSQNWTLECLCLFVQDAVVYWHILSSSAFLWYLCHFPWSADHEGLQILESSDQFSTSPSICFITDMATAHLPHWGKGGTGRCPCWPDISKAKRMCAGSHTFFDSKKWADIQLHEDKWFHACT